jgi:uncharacterized protein (TIGR02271 family)
MPIQLTDPAQLTGAKVYGRGGTKLGKVESVYFDNATDRPEWAAVKTGWFSSHVSLVPLGAAEFDGVDLTVPYAEEQVRSAPHHDPGQDLSPADEADLFEYYGVAYDRTGDIAEVGMGTPVVGREHLDASDMTTGTTRGHDTSGPTTDDAMTRSEEQLRVSTEQTTAGKARLRKHVVTEQQQVTVPVSHEEVRVEHEPITKENRGQAMDGPAISEEEHEVTLHAERPVVDKEAHPVERVRLGTETVTEDQQVGGEVRKEEIEVDDDETRRR